MEDVLASSRACRRSPWSGCRAPAAARTWSPPWCPIPGTTIDADALLAFARKHLAAYKVPRRVVVLDSLPRSLIGKVLRREIRDTLVAGR